jgi:hypothetical protein
LVFDTGQSILGVILGPADQIQELAMKLGSCRGDNLQVGEQPPGAELPGNFREQSPLAAILQMVDRKAGNDDVERPERRQWIIQIPLPNGNPLVSGKSPAGMLEHGCRCIHSDHFYYAGPLVENECCQPSVPTSEVEHRPRRVR